MRKCKECGEDLKKREDGRPCGVGFICTDGTTIDICMNCLDKWLEGIENIFLFGKIDK